MDEHYETIPCRRFHAAKATAADISPPYCHILEF
jgi:hypothetical protein